MAYPPEAMLEVIGPDTSNVLRFGTPNGTARLGAGVNRISILDTKGVERLSIDQTTGNVGIGTHNPSGRLDVAGDIVVSGLVESTSAGFKFPDGSVQTSSSPHLENLVSRLDASGIVGWTSSVAIGTDGLPLVSFYDATNDDLKVACCDNVFCSSASVNTIDSMGDVGLFSSIAIGADGMPVISYYGGLNLSRARCDARNAADRGR